MTRRCFGLAVALMLACSNFALAQEFKLVTRIDNLSRDAVQIFVETKIVGDSSSEAKAKTRRFFGEAMMDRLVALSGKKAITACSSYGLSPRVVEVERIIDLPDAPHSSVAKIRLALRVLFACIEKEPVR